jgi:hypothetical protein
MDHSSKPAVVMTALSWFFSLGTWFMKNIIEINQVLQFIAFVFAIASAWYAIQYYNRSNRK